MLEGVWSGRTRIRTLRLRRYIHWGLYASRSIAGSREEQAIDQNQSVRFYLGCKTYQIILDRKAAGEVVPHSLYCARQSEK